MNLNLDLIRDRFQDIQNPQQMARFRNLLVHVYWKIDYDRVYHTINEHLDDLRTFVQAIGELL
jgi:uncharacterized protein YutE (UPF0331/DUF86 family)